MLLFHGTAWSAERALSIRVRGLVSIDRCGVCMAQDRGHAEWAARVATARQRQSVQGMQDERMALIVHVDSQRVEVWSASMRASLIRAW